MRAVIWSVDKKRKSKFYDNAFNQVIVFKGIEDSNHITYKLNLDYRYMDTVNKWLPNMQVGNVLNVHLRSGTKTINAYAGYDLIEKKQASLLKEDPRPENNTKVEVENKPCDCMDYIEAIMKSHKEHKGEL